MCIVTRHHGLSMDDFHRLAGETFFISLRLYWRLKVWKWQRVSYICCKIHLRLGQSKLVAYRFFLRHLSMQRQIQVSIIDSLLNSLLQIFIWHLAHCFLLLRCNYRLRAKRVPLDNFRRDIPFNIVWWFTPVLLFITTIVTLWFKDCYSIFFLINLTSFLILVSGLWKSRRQ